MIIGVPKEIKQGEGRVSVTPAGVDSFVRAGHTVLIETNAGINSGFADDEYAQAGAVIEPTAADVFAKADMIIKVKEPLESEYAMLREGQIVFTYFHLAPDPVQTKALLERKIIGIGYETVQLDNGSLPLLSPMSEVAGRMSVQVGAALLEKNNGGRGVLLGGVPGVPKARVLILGGGTVGLNAARVAAGMGAQVTVVDISGARLAYIDDILGNNVSTLMSNPYNIAAEVKEADLVIGAVLVPGGRTPQLVTEEMVKTMKPGAAMVDVAIDQGGSIATMDRITTHDDPCFVRYGVVHYCVANMPGAVPRTSTFALANATLSYALMIANMGAENAMRANRALMRGLNVYKGTLTFKGVADAQGLPYTPAEEVL
ncbi:MAG: alanine dehydrogenase [Clostridia bacterium]|nr:alanine dehydrogenase [Clostridia bacterium]